MRDNGRKNTRVKEVILSAQSSRPVGHPFNEGNPIAPTAVTAAIYGLSLKELYSASAIDLL